MVYPLPMLWAVRRPAGYPYIWAMDTLWQALQMAGDMAWNTFWALVLGFTVSGAVQTFVSEQKMSQLLGGRGPKEILYASLFGAASSSCSFGAVATGKTLFKKGASAVAALAAFQFASTNLVIELGLVMWVLLGWQFVTANFVAGIFLILLLSLVFRFFPKSWIEQARRHVKEHEGVRDPVCGMEVEPDDAVTLEQNDNTIYFCSKSCKNTYKEQGDQDPLEAMKSKEGWIQASRNSLKDWNMLWKDILAGFVIAGLIGAFVPKEWWTTLFTVGQDGSFVRVLSSAVIGVFIGVATFVCSVGNVPFAAVLWKNGIPFGGVMSFIFADLIVPNITNAYRKYYGLRMAAAMFISIFLSATLVGVAIHYLWTGLGLVPSPGEVGGTPPHGYTAYLNAIFGAVFLAQLWVTREGKKEQESSSSAGQAAHASA